MVIAFIIYAAVILVVDEFLSYRKDKKPYNKVRFYVKRYKLGGLVLLIQDKYGNLIYICDDFGFKDLNLNVEDFKDLECNERREVYINLED